MTASASMSNAKTIDEDPEVQAAFCPNCLNGDIVAPTRWPCKWQAEYQKQSHEINNLAMALSGRGGRFFSMVNKNDHKNAPIDLIEMAPIKRRAGEPALHNNSYRLLLTAVS